MADLVCAVSLHRVRSLLCEVEPVEHLCLDSLGLSERPFEVSEALGHEYAELLWRVNE